MKSPRIDGGRPVAVFLIVLGYALALGGCDQKDVVEKVHEVELEVAELEHKVIELEQRAEERLLPSRFRKDAAVARKECAFLAGDPPARTLADQALVGDKIPIDHFVVLMQENRSFDHYYYELKHRGKRKVTTAPARFSNRSRTGEDVAPHKIEAPCTLDVPHGWQDVHTQIGSGSMDGFLKVVGPLGKHAMGYYGQETLPFYHWFASTFALADHHFSGVPGPTWPNRMFFMSGTSFGHIDNTPPPARDEELSLFHQLQSAGKTWAVYADEATFEEQIFPRLRKEKGLHFKGLKQFKKDAQDGNLPNFAWVASSFHPTTGTDEHAPSNIQLGQEFVAEMLDVTMKSPSWPKTAFILTYDEHGGFFDHVAPPAACVPDEHEPMQPKGAPPRKFDRLGVRVPLVVASPYSKPGYVSHETYSHTSVLRLIQARFGLPAITARDANAVPPFDLFDFSKPAFLKPPAAPPAVVDPKWRKTCAKRF